MKTLPLNLSTFPFYIREVVSGKYIRNRCGRDFLYTALAYYYPEQYGVGKISAYDLEHKGLLGISVPALFAWTQIQFLKAADYLHAQGLQLEINNRKISLFKDFVQAIIFSRASFEDALRTIEKSVDAGIASGVDISVGFGGLLDHVMFVYGYDETYLYVIETTKTPIRYEKISEKYPHVMKLPKEEIKKRWTRFGRVWKVTSLM
jgi:hypothetical protein